MKKIYIFGFIFFLVLLILCIIFLYPMQLNIKYLPYEQCTFEPLGISDIEIKEKSFQVKKYEYLQFFSILKKLNKIEEIEIDKNLKLEVNLGFEGDDNNQALNEDNFISGKNETNIVKIRLIDRFINVRYVIIFPNNKKIKRIVLGHNKNIIMINENFYLISQDNFKKLLLFFSKIIEDEINEETIFLTD